MRDPHSRVVATVVVGSWLFCSGGCGVLGVSDLPEAPAPLVDLEEMLAGFVEPSDEEERRALPRGGFTGIYVVDSRQSLEEMLGDAEGLLVDRVVENSPGEAAGVESGDLLLEAEGFGVLQWPSQWRDLELRATPGEVLEVVLDRAGREETISISTIPRLKPPERGEFEVFREEEKVGVVLRTPTEVEARSAGLAPGAGAVVIGLSRGSPWRLAGVTFGDFLVGLDGDPIDHPLEVLQRIRETASEDLVALEIRRDGEVVELTAPVSRRKQELKEFSIPLVFSYKRNRDESRTSFLLGLFSLRTTEAAWRVRLLWLIKFGGGDADRLAVVDSPDSGTSNP